MWLLVSLLSFIYLSVLLAIYKGLKGRGGPVLSEQTHEGMGPFLKSLQPNFKKRCNKPWTPKEGWTTKKQGKQEHISNTSDWQTEEENEALCSFPLILIITLQLTEELAWTQRPDGHHERGYTCVTKLKNQTTWTQGKSNLIIFSFHLYLKPLWEKNWLRLGSKFMVLTSIQSPLDGDVLHPSDKLQWVKVTNNKVANIGGIVISFVAVQHTQFDFLPQT